MAEAMNEGESDQSRFACADFPTTHWSAVLASRGTDPASAQSALETLCRAYWYPLYAYVRRNGHAPQDAEDSTQAFFLHLLGHDFLRNVTPEKGRFRSFLLASLKRFMAGEWRKEHALKRGGTQRAWSLDQQSAESRYLLEPADVADPETLYERRWALTLLDRVLERLEAEAAGSGKQALFARLQPLLTGDRDGVTYTQIAQDFGTTEGAIKMTVHRMRERLRVLFREEIAHTVGSEAEAEEEIRHLLATLGASPRVPGKEADRSGDSGSSG
jgi:RNA polymerase sigma factor (sigma-70 family)